MIDRVPSGSESSPKPGKCGSSIDFLIGRLAPIQPEETGKTLATFFYFTLVIMTYYIIKPATRAILMESLGAKNITTGNFTTALVIGFTVMLFDILAARFQRTRLVAVITGICATFLLLIWAGFRLDPQGRAGQALAISFFVFADIYSVLGVTLFWSFCHDIFTPAEGKRLYGVIGGGGALGGALGGVLAGKLAPIIGAENLPLVALIPLFGTVALAWIIETRFMQTLETLETRGHSTSCAQEARPNPDQSPARSLGQNPGKAPQREKRSGAAGIEGLRLIAESSYLQAMVGLLGAILLGSLIVETQFNLTVEKFIQETDARASFMGYRDTQLTVIQFISQVFLTGFLVRRLGLRGVLLIFPLGDLLMGLVFISSPTLAIANWAKIFDGAMKYGTNQVTKEMLYLPTPTAVKYQAKVFVDVFFHRIAKGAAAGLIWFMTNQMMMSETGLFIPLAITIVIWAVLVLLIGRLYHRMVEDRLRKLFPSNSGPETSIPSIGARDQIIRLLHSETPDRSELRTALLEMFTGLPAIAEMRGCLEQAFKSELRECPPLAVEWLSLNLPNRWKPLVCLMESTLPTLAVRQDLARSCFNG